MKRIDMSVRQQVWMNVAVGHARASNSTDPDLMVGWANQALKEFDKHWPDQKKMDDIIYGVELKAGGEEG